MLSTVACALKGEPVQSAEHVVVHLAEDVVRGATRVVGRDAGQRVIGFVDGLRVMSARKVGGMVPAVECPRTRVQGVKDMGMIGYEVHELDAVG